MDPKIKVGMPLFLEATSFSNARCKELGIVETKVTKVGRKYFEVDAGHQFEIATMKQVSEYSPDWLAYTSRQALEERQEKNRIYGFLRGYLNAYKPVVLTLDQLRRIQAIINE